MNTTEIKKLYSQARAYACSQRGYAEFADDFAQEYVLGAHIGKNQPVNFAFIDFVRTYFGSTRSRSGQLRISSESPRSGRQISLDAPQEMGEKSSGLLHEIIPDSQRDSRDSKGIELPYFAMRTRDAFIARLFFELEVGQADIAEILGVTPSLVSQLLRTIKKQIANKEIVRACYDYYQDDPEYSKLYIDWIAI